MAAMVGLAVKVAEALADESGVTFEQAMENVLDGSVEEVRFIRAGVTGGTVLDRGLVAKSIPADQYGRRSPRLVLVSATAGSVHSVPDIEQYVIRGAVA